MYVPAFASCLSVRVLRQEMHANGLWLLATNRFIPLRQASFKGGHRLLATYRRTVLLVKATQCVVAVAVTVGVVAEISQTELSFAVVDLPFVTVALPSTLSRWCGLYLQ